MKCAFHPHWKKNILPKYLQHKWFHAFHANTMYEPYMTKNYIMINMNSMKFSGCFNLSTCLQSGEDMNSAVR